jgi:hypothetical protein
MMSDGWTPKLSADGVHYCSPRCGSGKFCRKEWYDAAVANGDRLARDLGDGWEPRVWENLGWHYRAEKGCAAVHPNEDRQQPFVAGQGYPARSYSAFLNLPGKQFIASAGNAADALGFATQDARSFLRNAEHALSEIIEAGNDAA